jgi:hypothetical protein
MPNESLLPQVIEMVIPGDRKIRLNTTPELKLYRQRYAAQLPYDKLERVLINAQSVECPLSGGEPEILCSLRALLVLTQLGHGALVKSCVV